MLFSCLHYSNHHEWVYQSGVSSQSVGLFRAPCCSMHFVISLLGRVPGCHLAGAQCFRKLTSGQCWTHLSSALPDFGQTRTSMSIFGGSYRLQSRLGLSGLQGKLCSQAHPFILLQQCRCSVVGFRQAAGSAESSVFSAGRGS